MGAQYMYIIKVQAATPNPHLLCLRNMCRGTALSKRLWQEDKGRAEHWPLTRPERRVSPYQTLSLIGQRHRSAAGGVFVQRMQMVFCTCRWRGSQRPVSLSRLWTVGFTAYTPESERWWVRS